MNMVLRDGVTEETNSTTYTVAALVVSAVSSSLSVIGALFIFSTYFAMREIRNFTRKLVLCLTTADLLTAGGLLTSIIRYSVLDHDTESSSNSTTTPIFCVIQGTITAYSTTASFFFTFWIAVHILTTVVTQHARTATWRWFTVINVTSWGIPAVVMTLAVVNGAVGQDSSTLSDEAAGPWCWIKAGRHGTVNTALWRWLTIKGWEIACYLLTTTLYMTLKLYIYQHHQKERFQTIHSSLRDDDNKFLFVWFVLYIIRIWGTLRFLLVTYNNGKPKILVNVLLYFQAFGDPAQAFCNFFLFCVFDATVRSKLCCISGVRNRTESQGLLNPKPTRIAGLSPEQAKTSYNVLPKYALSVKS